MCCGATGIGDWANSSFNNKNKDPSFIDKLISSAAFQVPHSCCKLKESGQCDTATNIVAANTFSTELYSDVSPSVFYYLSSITVLHMYFYLNS